MATLQNKVVVITGASSGIGLACARAFARAGARLMISARREKELARVCEEIRAAGGQAHYQVMDVSNEAQCGLFVDAAMAQYGRIDILVNNAGFGHFLNLAETTAEDMRKLLDTNFFGTFYMSRAVLPIMRKQAAGHLISISSVAGKRVFRPGGGAYNVSKFAMQGFTEALRMELLDTPIHVSSICPVATSTEFFDLSQRQTGKAAKMHGPVQTAEYVAEVVVKVAHHPKPEVILVKPLRLVFALNALMPGVVDRLIARFLK